MTTYQLKHIESHMDHGGFHFNNYYLEMRASGGPHVFYHEVPRSVSIGRSGLPAVFFLLENASGVTGNLVNRIISALSLYIPKLLRRTTGGPLPFLMALEVHFDSIYVGNIHVSSHNLRFYYVELFFCSFYRPTVGPHYIGQLILGDLNKNVFVIKLLTFIFNRVIYVVSLEIVRTIITGFFYWMV